jgi:hypothetical protein
MNIREWFTTILKSIMNTLEWIKNIPNSGWIRIIRSKSSKNIQDSFMNIQKIGSRIKSFKSEDEHLSHVYSKGKKNKFYLSEKLKSFPATHFLS